MSKKNGQKNSYALLVLVPVAAAIFWVLFFQPSAKVAEFGGPVEGLTRDESEKFEECRKVFEHEFSLSEGLGPLYNGASCYSCHGAPGIAGGEGAENALITWIADRKKDRPLASESLEKAKSLLMLQDVDPLKNKGGPFLFRHSVTDPKQPLTGGNAVGSLITDADCKLSASSEIPKAELISKRHAPPLFGIGLLNSVMDDDIDDHEDDANEENTMVAGRSIDVHDPLTGKLRVGRFGLKAQHPNLVNVVSFMMNAGPGISTPVCPDRVSLDALPRCILAFLPPEPNDMGATAAKLIYYLSVLGPPKRGPITEEVSRGEEVFKKLDCAFCHTPMMQTAMSVRVIDPNSPAPKFQYTNIDALSNKTFSPYSDMLLHNLGPELSDGVPEGKASGGEWRTTPLWGLRHRKFLLHDGRNISIEDAVRLHGGQAAESRSQFEKLSGAEKADLMAFLRSL